MSKPGQIEPVIITLFGKPPSSKNRYMPMVGKDGKARFIKNSKLQNELDVLSCQIPAEYRMLSLEHPEVEVQFTVADQRSDRDNAWVGLSDLLVKIGVLKNDNVRRFNGRITIHPAILSDHWKTVITLTPTKPVHGRLLEK